MINLKQIIDFLTTNGIKFEVRNAVYDLSVKPASLKEIISNGLYFVANIDDTDVSHVRASIIITNTDVDTENVLILVENPQLVHYKLCELFKKPENIGIHETAIIHPEAVIGKSVSIGPFCVVEKCTIEDHVTLHSHVVVYENSVIKKHAYIDSQSCIGAPGLAWIWDEEGHRINQPQLGGVIIHEHCHLGTDITVVRGSLSENTVIGKFTVIAHGTKIGHGVTIGENVHMANNVSLAGNAIIGDRSFLGSASIVSSNIKIPENTIVGAGAMVNKNFPESFCTLAGIPAKIIKTENYKQKPKGAPKPFNN